MKPTGKPTAGSGACHTCRTRRIKCDETKPACLKCKKTNRVCPGYNDAKTLQFRDMTQTTIKKFEPRGRHRGRVSGLDNIDDLDSLLSDAEKIRNVYGFDVSTPAESSQPRTVQLARRGHTVMLPKYLVTPTEEKAMCYFVTAFNAIPDHSMPIQSYGFLTNILDRHPNSQCLHSSLTAAALAAFSTRPNSRRLRVQAYAHYSVALRAVRKALDTPIGVQGNDTMASVLALAFYEVLMSPDVTGYYYHLQGAAKIAQYRGESMLKDPLGYEFLKFINFELSKNMLMHTTAMYNHNDKIWENWLSSPFINRNPDKTRRESVPIRSRDLKEEARKNSAIRESQTKPKKKEDIVIRMIREARNIMGDIAIFDASAIDKVKIFVDRSNQILAAYAAPEIEMEGSMQKYGTTIYKRRALSEDSEGNPVDPATYDPEMHSAYCRTFDPLPMFGNVFIFKTPTYAMQMASAAGATLTAGHLVSRSTARIHPNGQHLHTREFLTARAACQRAIEIIVGSTPWLIGWRPPPDYPQAAGRSERALSPDTAEDWDEGQEGITALVIFYLWLILAAAGSEFATPAQRAYLISILRFLAAGRGLQQAEGLIKVIKGDLDEEALLSLVTGAAESQTITSGIMMSQHD